MKFMNSYSTLIHDAKSTQSPLIRDLNNFYYQRKYTEALKKVSLIQKTKNQICEHAEIAILAQANQSPETVLHLLE